MEENRNDMPEEEVREEIYVPRPAWQVWAARIGLVVFVALIIMYYINISRGGL